MTNAPRQILSLQLRSEQDVVLCRKRARDIAAALGFQRQDQIRIATALSEIARNAWVYGKGGSVEFSTDAAETNLLIDVVDHGAGISNLDSVMEGSYLSQTGMGIGIRGAHRLMDLVRIDTTSTGTTVHMEKRLYSRPPLAGNLAAAVELPASDAPFEEWHEQNRELVEALQELAVSEAQVRRLTGELKESNRVVVALRAELSEKASSLRRVSENVAELTLDHLPGKLPSSPRRILIIDADEAVRQMLKAQLPDESMVFESSEGEDGLRRAADWNPDIIFLDPFSNGIDGFEILKRLEDDPATRSIAVVIHTSHQLSVEERRILEARAAAILDKDLGPADQVVGKIRKIIEDSRQL